MGLVLIALFLLFLFGESLIHFRSFGASEYSPLAFTGITVGGFVLLIVIILILAGKT